MPMNGVWNEVAWLDQARLLLVGGDGASALWTSDLTGNQLTPVTREFGNFASMSLTADRTTAVAKRYTRSSGIWLSSASGADAEMRVPLSPAGAALPIVDAEGGLTYTAFKPDGVPAVYHLPRGASNPVQIADRTMYPAAGFFHDVSSDGRTIVYGQMERPFGLYRVRNDGSDRVKLLEGNTRTPHLTPDGKTVLFVRDSGLYSVPVDGGAERQLSERTVGRNISVSPDGSRVLFNTDKPGIVALCDLPGCTNLKDLPLRNARWAPDGAGVAYVENGTTIMEQPLDGGPPRRLAHLEGDERIINFRWSPDGSQLATSRGRYPNDLVLIKGLR